MNRILFLLLLVTLTTVIACCRGNWPDYRRQHMLQQVNGAQSKIIPGVHNPIKLTQQFRRKLTHFFPGKDFQKHSHHISLAAA